MAPIRWVHQGVDHAGAKDAWLTGEGSWVLRKGARDALSSQVRHKAYEALFKD